MAQGRTIKLFLADGTPSGLMTVEIMNWSGKALVCPRAALPHLASREEAKRTGVHLLVGPDPAAPLKTRVYIGESDNCFARLVQHDKDESNDFCTRIVLLVSKDANLTKAHVRYLEHRLIALAKAAGRATLDNTTGGSPVSLPESDVADMEGFLEQVQMILPVIGIDVTQPLPEAPATAGTPAGADTSPVFELQVVGALGRAQVVGGTFFLLKGSTARRQGVPAWTSYKEQRAQLVEDGMFAVHPEQPDFLVVTQDLPLASPSAGAAMVAGRNMNGPQTWKVPGTGQTYAAWRESALQAAQAGLNA